MFHQHVMTVCQHFQIVEIIRSIKDKFTNTFSNFYKFLRFLQFIPYNCITVNQQKNKNKECLIQQGHH